MKRQVKILYFSDVLCVWAYAAQIRLDELSRNYGAKVVMEHRMISIFGSTEKRIGQGWQDRGGFEGFARHVAGIVGRFDHIRVNPAVWRGCRPKSSMPAHLFIKAVQLIEETPVGGGAPGGQPAAEALIWGIRRAFFEEARDIGRLPVLFEIADGFGLPCDRIDEQIQTGAAMAALSEDFEQQSTYQLAGSPSYLMNDGRQKLYGNVGYRVLDANVAELLNNPEDAASWC